MKFVIAIFAIFLSACCTGQAKKTAAAPATAPKVVKTDEQWRKELSAEQYHVLREKGTERPYTGEYDRHFEKGYYACAGCKQRLFASQNKFDSGCGWPSFDQAIKGSVVYKSDRTLGMERTEVLCSGCGGHLGHVFDDGPKNTTGQRYCMNSVSLEFIPEG